VICAKALKTKRSGFFASNLKDLLLSAWATGDTGSGSGTAYTGLRVGGVDATGKLVEHNTIFPHAPRNPVERVLPLLAH